MLEVSTVLFVDKCPVDLKHGFHQWCISHLTSCFIFTRMLAKVAVKSSITHLRCHPGNCPIYLASATLLSLKLALKLRWMCPRSQGAKCSRGKFIWSFPLLHQLSSYIYIFIYIWTYNCHCNNFIFCYKNCHHYHIYYINSRRRS